MEHQNRSVDFCHGLAQEMCFVLESLARIAPLIETLSLLVRRVEALCGGMLCSILLLDRDGIHLRCGPAPSLPGTYTAVIDGLSIGPDAAPCGAAAYLRKRIICPDITNDPAGSPFREVAMECNLRACWATPICAADEEVLGIFSCYYAEVRTPSEYELGLVDRMVYLAQIAIERQRTQEDRAERKRLEEQLQQSHKMEAIGRLAGGVAHDFNNLLTAIIGHSELILTRLDDSSPIRSEIEEIKKAGERAALLTRQLLAFSRKQVLQPAILNLNDLLDNMSRMLRRLIREDIRLMTQGRSDLWLVKADPGQMQQIILNLALNARDAMPQGGSLTLRVSNATLDEEQVRARSPMKAGQYVRFSVSDTGEGMDATTRARIFEPFFTTKELGKGTGLGLSTVYGIVKQSEGYIWVESQPGKGATFEIYLPRVEESVDLPKAEMLPPPPVAELKTILVVEDDDAVRRPIRRMLEMNGYQVLEARSPDEALRTARLERGRIDLLLTDMVMPRMSGRELAGRLASLNRSIRILYMSGHTEDPDVMEAAGDECRDFIQKPFSGSALTRKVQEIFARSRG